MDCFPFDTLSLDSLAEIDNFIDFYTLLIIRPYDTTCTYTAGHCVYIVCTPFFVIWLLKYPGCTFTGLPPFLVFISNIFIEIIMF